jgi:glycosyltransferase involved in cell wall biosynthesis
MSYLKSPTPLEADNGGGGKLYFIACCFPPFGRGNAITNSCVANFLSESFSLKVVCMKLSRGGLISYQEDESLEKKISLSIDVTRIEGANWWGMNTALYLLGLFPCYFLNWAWNVWRKRDEIFSERGVVFAVYPVFSDLILGYFISRKKNMPLLIDFRDDFSGVMARGWRKIFHPFYRFYEEKIVDSAQIVTVTTEALKQDILSRYNISSDKVVVVNNIVPTVARKRDVSSPRKLPFSVIYAGAMSEVQQPEVLLKAYHYLCQEDANWQKLLNVDLYGPASPYFNMKIRSHIGDGCNFGGFLPQEEISAQISSSDIGFLSLSDPVYAYATPTKLFDYIESGVPIVACLPEGAARSMILDLEIGLVAEVGDVIGLADCLRSMVEDDQLRLGFRRQMAEVRERFRPEIQVKIWKDLLVDMGMGTTSDPIDIH